MDIFAADRGFAGAIPEVYERYMVPMLFEPYARELAARIGALAPVRVLELAAGTGVVTRALAPVLPSHSTIVATDLNPQMLDQARAIGGIERPVAWREADAMSLPFADDDFDLVVCQFGLMFFPDKPRALAEAARVLRPGGTLVFNVWDRIEHNDFAQTVQSVVGSLFVDDPPSFMARVPHGYFDFDVIRRDLRAGGFDAPATITTVSLPTTAPSPRAPAIALCQGTPMRTEIEAHGATALQRATDAATAAVTERFGSGAVTGASRAFVVVVQA